MKFLLIAILGIIEAQLTNNQSLPHNTDVDHHKQHQVPSTPAAQITGINCNATHCTTSYSNGTSFATALDLGTDDGSNES